MPGCANCSNDFRIGDRVICNQSYVGRVDYHLANGRILVRDDRGNTKAYWPDAIELAEPRRHEDDEQEDDDEPRSSSLLKAVSRGLRMPSCFRCSGSMSSRLIVAAIGSFLQWGRRGHRRP
jgi:hypothetical protein